MKICSLFLSLFLVSCASPKGATLGIGSSGGPGGYAGFDSWRMSNRVTPYAAKGNQKALHDLFLAAYLRANVPAAGGEDLQQISSNFSEVATAVGDSKFSHALSCERPEIVSAVGALSTLSAAEFPKTTSVLKKAPKIDFPMLRAIRDVPTPLLLEFTKAEESN